MLSTLANLEAFKVAERTEEPMVSVTEPPEDTTLRSTTTTTQEDDRKCEVREESVTEQPQNRGVLSTKPKTAKSVPQSLSAAQRGRQAIPGKSREIKTSTSTVSSKEVTPDSTR